MVPSQTHSAPSCIGGGEGAATQRIDVVKP
jgi:hypothetical protein